MAVGVLRLKPEQEDPQDPHLYDEIYYIIKGDGYLRVDDKDIEVKEGKIIFVPAYTKHKFHDNTKELIALYVFAGEDKDITD
ncbi:MAG: cupin domain-containing protein [Candidatus Nitrosothermus koennekii]|nr:MAG: cupin domain-containing protein [Candidatus Nitrosothermus koennekii]